jgi:predicted nucleic acid-binding protein
LREDLAVVNQLIMAEIVPALEIRKQKSAIADLKILTNYEMNISWDEIVKLQIRFVKEFKYFVAITDLAIFQNARENDLVLYSFDRDLISLCKMTRHTFLK